MSRNQQIKTKIDVGITTAQRTETGVPQVLEKQQVLEAQEVQQVPEVLEKQQVPQAPQVKDEYDSVPMRFYPQWVKQVQTPEGRLPHNVARHPNITKETLPQTEREFWCMLENAWLKTEGKSNRPQCAGTYNGTAWNCAGTAPAGQMNCHQCREAHARFMMDGYQPAMNY